MAAVSKIENGVVELRTDVGSLYVCPAQWQRLYLRWTFRNFHSLPLQILNPRQKRLIESLSRSAIVTPTERVPVSAIIGIVENMRVLAPAMAETAEPAKPAKPAVAEAKLAVLQGRAEDAVTESGAPHRGAGKLAKREPVPEITHSRTDKDASEPEKAEAEIHSEGRGTKRGSWSLVLAGTGMAAILLLAIWLAPLWRSPQLRIVRVPLLPPQFATERKPAVSSSGLPQKRDGEPKPVPALQASGHAAKQAAHSAAAAASAIPVPISAPLPQIVEPPRSGFIYPAAPNPNLVGKVALKAVVGSDGMVKEVEVLSGDRTLAAAAVRAVRQWRYAPAQLGGRTGEAETHVTISFLGDDAISIILPQRR
jgi:TonB family protein